MMRNPFRTRSARERLLTIGEVVLVLLLGFAILGWFRGDTVIMTSASVWPLNWNMYLEKTLSVWDDSIGTGQIASRQIAALPLALIGASMDALGISLSLAQKFLFYFWFAGSGLAMLFLCRVFQFPRLARVSAALFYMISPYALVTVWSQTDGLFMPIYLGAPLGVGLFVSILRRQKRMSSILCANLLLLGSLSSIGLTNPAFAVVLSTPLLVAAVGYTLLHPGQWRGVLWRTGAFGLVALFMNAFWIIPLVTQISDEFVQASHQILQAEDPSHILRSDIDTYSINSVRAVDALRLTGLWSVTAEHAGDPYYVWGASTEEEPMRTLSFFLPLLIVLGIMSSPRQPRGAFFALLFLVSGFFVLGTFPPGEETRLTLHTAFPPLLRAFRATYGKWGLLLSVSAAPLAGLGLSTLARASWGWRRRQIFGPLVAMVVLGVLVGILGKPVWTGDIIHPQGRVLQPARVRVPLFYNAFQQWAEQQNETFRILPLPLSKIGSTAYRWKDSGYVGGDFIRWYSPRHPVLFAGTRNPLMLALAETINSPTFTSDRALQRVLGLLNARFVLMHHDFYWPMNENFMMFNDLNQITAFLRRGLLKDVKRFGDLEILQPPPSSFVPKLYAATRLTYVMSSGAHLADALTFPDTPALPALYVHETIRPKNEDTFAWKTAQEFVVTTSFDEEKVAQAQRDLSDARAARSAFAEEEERKIKLLQRSLNVEEGRSLRIPYAGRYEIAIAQSRVSDAGGHVSVSLTDATGRQHVVMNSVSATAETGEHYRALGEVELPAGPIRLTLTIGKQELSVLPPGTLILRTRSATPPPPTPTVTFNQASPTRYVTHVSGATSPFALVFSETFHPRWEATVQASSNGEVSVASPPHLPINGYANAWWITTQGNFDIVVNFAPQQFVVLGMLVTAGTIVASLGVLAVNILLRYTRTIV